MKEISLESLPHVPKLSLPVRFWVYQQRSVKDLVCRVRQSRRSWDSGRFQAEPKRQTCCGNFWLTSDPKSVTKFNKNKQMAKTPQQGTFIYLLSLNTFLHESQNAVEGCDKNLTNRKLQLQFLIWADNLDKIKHTHVLLKEMHPYSLISKSSASQDWSNLLSNSNVCIFYDNLFPEVIWELGLFSHYSHASTARTPLSHQRIF